jgi:hypothetical protein
MPVNTINGTAAPDAPEADDAGRLAPVAHLALERVVATP